MSNIVFVPAYVCGECYSPRLAVDMVVSLEVPGLFKKGRIRRTANKDSIEGYCLECGITSNDMIPCEAIIVFRLPATEVYIIARDEMRGFPKYVIARQLAEDTGDTLLFKGKPSVITNIADSEVTAGLFEAIKKGA